VSLVVPIGGFGGPQVVRGFRFGQLVIVGVTTLGSSASGLARAAGQVVGYLEGVEQEGGLEQRRSQPGSQPQIVELGGPSNPASVGSYYADSADRPGVWRGSGAVEFGLGHSADPEVFERLLLGRHPHSGIQLVGSQGSNGRTDHHSPAAGKRRRGPLTADQVADLVGVDVSYIRRIAARTARIRTQQRIAARSGEMAPELPGSFLDAEKDSNGRWSIRRDEAERFAAQRAEAKVVLGYDITWSVPKSVSALYAQGTEADRRAVEESMEAAVSAGMAYLESDGFHVRQGRDREKASNMVAASYRHYTNRALEPQLHEHVVVANMATNSRGETKAVDARGLFAHATAASYLAAAELRTQLTGRLGIGWGPIHNGIADIDGVDRETIMAISSRRKAVLSLSEEMGYSTAGARQTAALATRPAKDRSVEAEELQDRWRQILDGVGFDRAAVEALDGRNELTPWTAADTEELFAHLASDKGVTEQAAVFDRRDVLQEAASFAGDRLTASDIVDLADHWLHTEAVIPLKNSHRARGETIGSGAAQVSLAPDEQRYSTPAMLDLEQRVLNLHGRSVGAGFAVVDPKKAEAAITESQVDLGADQAAMVRAICGSGDQFQAVVGRAGAGKTTALRAAVTAWETAGFDVRGAAPFGEAARNLEAETGLRSTTLEGLLTRLDAVDDPATVISRNTVIVVDEASTIGNRQLDRLYRHAHATGAAVRTIGDPHQHQSVEAGGLWKHLTNEFADHTPSLEVNRRQTGAAMGQVRLALDEYRTGRIAEAMQRLDRDDRVVVAADWEELLDSMAADWFVDHQRHTAGDVAGSKMIAERNSDRHALNRRAQTLLRADGPLGAPVEIGEAVFHVGDRVVAQATNRDLRPREGSQRDHVINGSQGTVIAIKGTRRAPDLLVDFDGLGTIRVPHEFITGEVGPGRGGGLTPGYAVTSFKAEGQTYDAGRNLAAPGAVNTEGMYVALTRGRHDQRTYTIDPAALLQERSELPVVADDRAALEALSQALTKTRNADLATVVDPDAARIGAESTRPLGQIGGRSLSLAEMRISGGAIYHPDPVTVAALGPRPPTGDHRGVWDHAVSQAALYRAHYGTKTVTLEGSVEPAMAGDGPRRHDHYDHVRAAVSAADAKQFVGKSLGDVLGQRHEANTSHDHRPKRDLEQAKDRLVQAEHDLTDARGQLDSAQHSVERFQVNGRPRRRDRSHIETARHNLVAATQAFTKAEVVVDRATRRLERAHGDNIGNVVADARVAAADRSIDRRIAGAVRRPASYITGTLGRRPTKDVDARRWDTAAGQIETYRHHHLGYTPQRGALPGEGLTAAIGPQPRLQVPLRFWKQTHRQIEQHLAQPLHQEIALQRTR
jgi:conjugative relaxase-like TrwC/TraI family protein